MRYFVQFSYDGTNYHGSQVQPNGVTVQEVLEGGFSTILRHKVSLTFAGRTDAGVHALMMYAHFDEESELGMTPEFLCLRLNMFLPESIAVQRIFPVSDDMHARFSACSRTYEYHLTTKKNPFLFGRSMEIHGPLNVEAMQEAAQRLIGTKDFAAFCKTHTDVKTTICTVTEAQFIQRDDHIVFRITADRFLRNMVRAITGTLLLVGQRGRPASFVTDVLNAHNRCNAGSSVPAEGLFLVEVRY